MRAPSVTREDLGWASLVNCKEFSTRAGVAGECSHRVRTTADATSALAPRTNIRPETPGRGPAVRAQARSGPDSMSRFRRLRSARISAADW